MASVPSQSMNRSKNGRKNFTARLSSPVRQRLKNQPLHPVANHQVKKKFVRTVKNLGIPKKNATSVKRKFRLQKLSKLIRKVQMNNRTV